MRASARLLRLFAPITLGVLLTLAPAAWGNVALTTVSTDGFTTASSSTRRRWSPTRSPTDRP
jgi:hypothetical protein